MGALPHAFETMGHDQTPDWGLVISEGFGGRGVEVPPEDTVVTTEDGRVMRRDRVPILPRWMGPHCIVIVDEQRIFAQGGYQVRDGVTFMYDSRLGYE